MRHFFSLFICVASLAVLTTSCRKPGLCKDADFTIPKAANNSSMLRTDGVYYAQVAGEKDRYELFVLYRDGVVLAAGSTDSANIVKYLSSQGPHLKDDQARWGVYAIQGNVVNMEHHKPVFTGCATILQSSCQIESDTSFVLTRRVIMEKNGDLSHEEKQERAFHFLALISKPDSTNNIIK